mmetsp:Transcript_330/g.741  ORF Transcript_330/g.741 Transcript_330/m.741 type:complete len:335 (+) Transcript_330:48-1052(+)
MSLLRHVAAPGAQGGPWLTTRGGMMCESVIFRERLLLAGVGGSRSSPTRTSVTSSMPRLSTRSSACSSTSSSFTRIFSAYRAVMERPRLRMTLSISSAVVILGPTCTLVICWSGRSTCMTSVVSQNFATSPPVSRNVVPKGPRLAWCVREGKSSSGVPSGFATRRPNCCQRGDSDTRHLFISVTRVSVAFTSISTFADFASMTDTLRSATNTQKGILRLASCSLCTATVNCDGSACCAVSTGAREKDSEGFMRGSLGVADEGAEAAELHDPRRSADPVSTFSDAECTDATFSRLELYGISGSTVQSYTRSAMGSLLCAYVRLCRSSSSVICWSA